jgi:chaperonin GroES
MPLNFEKSRVMNNYAIVRPLAPEQFTSGGLLKPDEAQERPHLGIVIAIGPGERHAITGVPVPMHVQAGDLVTFTAYAGIELDAEQNLTLMRETEIGVAFPPTEFSLVKHEDPKKWHLAESFCQVCDEARKAADKQGFEAMRQEHAGHLGKAMNVRPGLVGAYDPRVEVKP